MPPDISATARPLIPTGRPPCPGCPPVNTNTSRWSTSMKISVSGCFRLTGSPCAACTSRPMMTASSDEVTGNRLSRRRGRTANAPLCSLVSSTAAATAASGVFGTRIARQTRTIPGTSLTRSATRSTALACSAAVRCSRSTRSTTTPSRSSSSTGRPVSRIAARMLPWSSRSNCCLLRPLRTISPSLSSTHGSLTACCAVPATVAGSVMDIPPVCQLCRRPRRRAAPRVTTGIPMAPFPLPWQVPRHIVRP